MSGPIITLLSDFGYADGYAAAMKGVILDLAPRAVVVDAAHGIPPQDVQAGAWVLAQYAFYFPPGTIHLAVVDPGVGTDRDALVARAGGQIFVAPGNGLLHWVSRTAAGFDVRRIRDSVHRDGEVSSTFHGRDIFAYTAGLIARGPDPIEALTAPVEELFVPGWGEVRSEGGGVAGVVVHIDRFGNLITGIHRRHVESIGSRRLLIQAGQETLDETLDGLRKTYQQVPHGSPLALIGSHDHLEIAVSGGSAALKMGLRRGDRVAVSPRR